MYLRERPVEIAHVFKDTDGQHTAKTIRLVRKLNWIFSIKNWEGIKPRNAITE
jgi:hypothetical protein